MVKKTVYQIFNQQNGKSWGKFIVEVLSKELRKKGSSIKMISNAPLQVNKDFWRLSYKLKADGIMKIIEIIKAEGVVPVLSGKIICGECHGAFIGYSRYAGISKPL
ncbi:MAG: hypothetical protein CVV02_05430 [Firmicutes bacterium HGW-Firmicutes-7]|nr:MAG: hypothetical protein CVV02_05430 [Firmicutes bacterium HGW-Firmicutes-7]